MISHPQMQLYVDRINEKFNVHALWNGYQIRMFKRKNLVIGGSQDWIYYHNIDVIFKKVIFFNLPPAWHDTAIPGDDLFRLSTQAEFRAHHPDFNPLDRHIFAIDMNYEVNGERGDHIHFVVAANVFYELFNDPPGDGMIEYDDFRRHSSKENRVK